MTKKSIKNKFELQNKIITQNSQQFINFKLKLKSASSLIEIVNFSDN